MFICFEYTVHKGELPVLVATYLGKKKKKECRSGKRCDLWGLSLIGRMNNSFLIKVVFQDWREMAKIDIHVPFSLQAGWFSLFYLMKRVLFVPICALVR